MTLAAFIATYGYIAILVGVFVEGEAVVMTAGFLAHRNLLDLHWVMGAALIGSVVTYNFFFLLGRFQGTRFLERHPDWQRRVARIQRLLTRHHTWVTLGYRALFGFRAITPFALGMTDIRYRRFVALDIVPAVLWAVTFSWLGYALGEGLQAGLDDMQHLQGWAAGAVATALLVSAAFTYMFRRLRA